MTTCLHSFAHGYAICDIALVSHTAITVFTFIHSFICWKCCFIKVSGYALIKSGDAYISPGSIRLLCMFECVLRSRTQNTVTFQVLLHFRTRMCAIGTHDENCYTSNALGSEANWPFFMRRLIYVASHPARVA